MSGVAAGAPAWVMHGPESGDVMALPKILGSETEYGLMVQNDPEFDSIATSLLLVTAITLTSR